MADDPEITAAPTDGAPTEPESSEPSAPGPAAPPADPFPQSFTNPADLPPELRKIYGQMHKSYEKLVTKARAATEKAAFADRLFSDEAFAAEQVQQWAAQRGITLTKGQAAQAATQALAGTTPAPSSGHGSVPAELVSAMESELPPELRWMARPLAASQWKAHQATMGPVLARTEQQALSTRTAEYDALAEELSEAAPGWEQHEEDMVALLDFLQSKDMRSKRFGSKLELLHRLVTGQAVAVREATRRMGEAARNRMTTGQSSRTVAPNVSERVLKARSTSEAVRIAAQHAREQLAANGITLPD